MYRYCRSGALVWDLLSILPLERVSKAVKSFAEASEAVTNRSTQASKSRSKAVSWVI